MQHTGDTVDVFRTRLKVFQTDCMRMTAGIVEAVFYTGVYTGFILALDYI